MKKSKIDKYIDFLNFMEKPENKAFSFLYLIILLILYVSLHLKTYYYLLANNNTFTTFQKNNTYLVNALLFITAYIGLKIVVNPIHFISKVGIYKKPKFTFIIFLLLTIYVVYTTYNTWPKNL
jgi:predicted tellurium resistance membrane protein TerC